MALIDPVNDVSTVSGLFDREPPSLSAWYAEPLDTVVAGDLLVRAEAGQQACLRAGESCFRLRVLAIICHAWLGSEPEIRHEALAALAGDAHERALLDLVQGQLLASRKISGAMEYLQNGFRLAAPQLGATEYFALLQRHDLLDCLPYSVNPSVPQNLASLLNEAAVINRLRVGERRHHVIGHLDTVG
ncbi:MAG: hypothetical protein HKP57_04840 [Halobacteria archaeon]|nr:hypothetical protein [Halobacteria archaeon]